MRETNRVIYYSSMADEKFYHKNQLFFNQALIYNDSTQNRRRNGLVFDTGKGCNILYMRTVKISGRQNRPEMRVEEKFYGPGREVYPNADFFKMY